MNAEFFEALAQIEKEKGIPQSYMQEKITQALITAYKRDFTASGDNIDVRWGNREISMYVNKSVSETPLESEISLEEARRIDPTAAPGDVIAIPVDTRKFGRIAAQTAKQVIIQGIREAERGMVFQEYASKEHDIITAVVTKADARGGALLEIGGRNEKNEVLLTSGEQVRGERLCDGDRVKVYVVEVRRAAKGPQILISRTHPGLVRRLFELEVPEIYDGTVEIKAIVREAGQRTKMAVWSNDDNVDPVGACVGNRGAHVNAVVDELKGRRADGEKIDIVKYSEDPAEFISAALAPASVLSVELSDDGSRSCRANVPAEQLSLAIGKEGQNARLAAKLTGYKIDIKAYGG